MSAETAAEANSPAAVTTGLFNPAALGAVAIWSATAPIGKYALQDFPTLAYSSLRPVIGAILLFSYLYVRKQPIRLPAADLKRIAFVGVFGVALSQLCYIGALATTSVAHTVILASISPLIVAMYRLTVKRSPLHPIAMLGILGGFAGVVLLVGGSSSSAGTSLEGDALALISAVTWMLVTIMPAKVIARHGTLQPMAWMVLSSLLISLPVSASSIVETARNVPPPLAWASLAYTAICGALIANALWQRAVQQVGPAKTLIYLYLQPVGAMILAAMLLGERLTAIQAIGGALALAGVGLVRRG
jgi:drug/metabolite transporter (DMT)-like permease